MPSCLRTSNSTYKASRCCGMQPCWHAHGAAGAAWRSETQGFGGARPRPSGRLCRGAGAALPHCSPRPGPGLSEPCPWHPCHTRARHAQHPRESTQSAGCALRVPTGPRWPCRQQVARGPPFAGGWPTLLERTVRECGPVARPTSPRGQAARGWRMLLVTRPQC